jgi:hypothetical protein
MTKHDPQPFDPEKFIDAAAPLAGLDILTAYRPGIAAHLVIAHRIAQAVLAVELEDDAGQAPVYRP